MNNYLLTIKVITNQYVNVNCTTCYFDLREVSFIRCSVSFSKILLNDPNRAAPKGILLNDPHRAGRFQ
jgi:hypothetical protein